MNYPAEQVFAAACAAHRVNGEYVKGTRWPDVAAPDAKLSNRKLMMQFLSPDCAPMDEADIEQGRKVRTYFQSLTFKILSGVVLSEFDSNALALSNRDELSSNYELAVVCSFPASFERGVARQTAESRVNFASGGYVGKVGDKVTITCEILRSFYSQQWATSYVTAITPDDQALFFAYKQTPEIGSTVTVTGYVKAHRDNQSQLNRCKIV